MEYYKTTNCSSVVSEFSGCSWNSAGSLSIEEFIKFEDTQEAKMDKLEKSVMLHADSLRLLSE